jgi:GNAT superfamily N-acetyltransferase
MTYPIVPAEIIAAAAAEGWEIRPPTLATQPIVGKDRCVVGFYCPHPAGRGYCRVGPIYVLPAYRGQRYGQQAYSALQHVALMAYTHPDNRASERLHEIAGFSRWYRRGGQFWRRPAIETH